MEDQMSVFTYFAADFPLEDRKNSHNKFLSVNEALDLGIEVGEELLASNIDRDEPGIMLWCDREIIIDTKSHSIDDGNDDDDFIIFQIDKSWDDIYTDKQYLACLECSSFTTGRTKQIIDYIGRQLQHADEIEFWYIWMGCEYRPRIRRHRIPINELMEEDIKDLMDIDVWKEPYTQYCITISHV
jgi:hypothetical protein